MSTSASSATWDSYRIGILAGTVGALGYTAANIFLRVVAVDCDAVFVSFIKAIPIALATGGAICWLWAHGSRPFITVRWAIYLFLVAVLMQLAGNVAFQWALGQIGLALTVPLCMGMLLVGSAVLARIWLSEPIHPKTAVATILLIVSVTLLSMVAEESVQAVRPATNGQLSGWRMVLILGAVCISGISYGVGNVVIRRALATGIHLLPILAIISLTGVAILGVISIWTVDRSTVAVHWENLWAMVFAGIFNAVAFYALGQALQRLPVLHTNLLTASQVMLCALFGIVWFHEPAGTLQLVGIALTLFGLVLMQRPRPKHEHESRQ